MPLTPELRAFALAQENARVRSVVERDPGVDAQSLIAQFHGFESWPLFVQHVHELERPDSAVSRFEAAADAIVNGEMETLRQLSANDSSLVSARSQRRHNSTLLHYVAANGVENFRQKTPQNIVGITKLLLDSGAEVDALSEAYCGRCTALGLAATSVHPERAGVQEALLEVLLEYGADIDKSDAGGNGQTVVEGCLWNGRPRAAAFFASRGGRLTVEAAAGLGRLDLLRSHLSDTIVWNRQLQRGFLCACGYGHEDVVRFLLDRGADFRDQTGTGQPPLQMAVIGAHLGVVRLLLERGAPLEERNSYGGTALGQAEWCFGEGNQTIDYLPIFEALLGAGAVIDDGAIAWIERQFIRTEDERARLAALYRRFGSV